MTRRPAVMFPSLLLAFMLSGNAMAAELEDYFGTYVGVAEVAPLDGGGGEERHIDITISRYKDKGFRIEWIAVSLVDGRRDVPGVERQKHEVLFEPGDRGCCYVQVGKYDPFREREALKPMLGEPVRWAVLDDNGLQIYSFAILEQGAYELQSYNRSLTDVGIDLLYELVEDGVVKRRVTGHTVRTEH